jgi:hypothetical protein
LSQAIDALQKIATRDDEPRTLRRRMMTNATDGVEMRRRGVIPSTRYLARYDEMLRMLASGRTIMAIAEHYGLSRQRVHQLLRVKHLDPEVRRAARNPKALPGKCPAATAVSILLLTRLKSVTSARSALFDTESFEPFMNFL